jgi:hypothetical protein
MTKADKIRQRIADGDGNLRFDQVDAYLTSIGATKREGTGSHVFYRLPIGGASATLVRPYGGRTTISARYIRNLHDVLRGIDL